MATIIGSLGSDTITPGLVTPGVVGGAPGDGADSIAADDGGHFADYGSDVVDGGGGNDTIDGGDGYDTLDGGTGDDSLDGGRFHDLLVGGDGSDTMRGGGGHDTYIVDTPGDLLIEGSDFGEGIDRVRTALAAYELPENVEYLTGLADTGQSLVGNALVNFLEGGAGNDTLSGELGNDHLIGGSGADHMMGGDGDDTYVVDAVGDLVVERLNGGRDLVVTERRLYTLPSNVEDLAAHVVDPTPFPLTGFTLVGNGLHNAITGASSADMLDGGAGRDTLSGGAGHDTYIVDTHGDLVLEAPDQGNDRVETALAAYTLPANVEILVGLADTAQRLVGNALDNIVVGRAGGDTLVGGLGNDSLGGGDGVDRLLGGADDDSYMIDSVGDVVIEGLNLGLDTVYTTLATYWLAANVENLLGFNNSVVPQMIGYPVMGHRLVGNALANLVTGRDGADTLVGGIGADTLVGLGGADVLNGGLGDDSMAGGADDDAYFVDAVGDLVLEAAAAGFDTVFTSLATYTLADNVERLVGRATTGQRLVGNAQDNFIAGSSGADTLDGGEGGDDLLGGAGDDLYIVGAWDVVLEEPNRGHDTVIATEGTAYGLHGGVEVLVLGGATVTTGTGNAGRNTIIGNTLDNALDGLDGADRLSGDDGADSLSGGGGADTLAGGAGADTLMGEAGADRFRIDAATDSGPLAADLILGLAFAEGDRIDLRQIDADTFAPGDQAFAWIGSAAFAATGAGSAGQLRVTLLAPGQWRAEGDVDGNGLADLQIDIASATGPGAGGWFIV